MKFIKCKNKKYFKKMIYKSYHFWKIIMNGFNNNNIKKKQNYIVKNI